MGGNRRKQTLSISSGFKGCHKNGSEGRKHDDPSSFNVRAIDRMDSFDYSCFIECIKSASEGNRNRKTQNVGPQSRPGGCGENEKIERINGKDGNGKQQYKNKKKVSKKPFVKKQII